MKFLGELWDVHLQPYPAGAILTDLIILASIAHRMGDVLVENVDDDEFIGRGIDRINSRYFDEAGNRASGLALEEIGLDGHAVANTLWKISAYLRRRADGE